MPLNLINVSNYERSFNCNNLFIYSLVNYQSGGLLLDIYKKEGIDSLRDVLISSQFSQNMYRNGIGKEFDTSKSSQILCNISESSDLKPINENSRKVCWKLHLRGLYGESILHILVINNTKIHSLIAKQILELYPNLSNDVFEEMEYFGVSSLHLAIVYRNESLVETLLQCNANVNQRAVGYFFSPKTRTTNKNIPSFDESLYFGEYPLSWAASINDKRIYNTLINYGANPNMMDTFGNMVLHVIVSREKLNIYCFALRHTESPAKNDLKNKYGLTPIALACVLGKANIFKEIIELSCQEFWTYNIVTCCGYPLNVVDSMQTDAEDKETHSALDLILEGNTSEHLDMLKGGVIQKLLEEKWKTFGHRLFLRKIFQTLIHLFVISIAVYMRSSKNEPKVCESKVKKIVSLLLNHLKNEHAPIKQTNNFRLSIEIMAVISCLRQIFIQLKQFSKMRKLNLLANMSSSLPQITFFISNTFIIFCLLFRFFDNILFEEIFLIMALPTSWFFLMFFAAAVRITGPFVAMVKFMVLQDMRQFSIIYMVFLYGFSQTFYFLLKQPKNQMKASNHEWYYSSWMELFRMTLGAHQYEELRNSYYHWLTQLFFVLFMILMPILLLNMLIAMMGNTYSLVISESEREWIMQWAKILLELEKALSPKECKQFLSQYTITISPKSGAERPALMVIKKMKTSKAKKSKLAVNNWKRLYRRVRLTKKMTRNQLKDQLIQC